MDQNNFELQKYLVFCQPKIIFAFKQVTNSNLENKAQNNLNTMKILTGIHHLKTVTRLLRSQRKRHYLRVRKQEDSYKGKKEVVILQLRFYQGYMY